MSQTQFLIPPIILPKMFSRFFKVLLLELSAFTTLTFSGICIFPENIKRNLKINTKQVGPTPVKLHSQVHFWAKIFLVKKMLGKKLLG